MILSENFKKRLLFLAGIKTEQNNNSVLSKVKQKIWTANDFDDCIKAIEMQYGKIVPLFHATTSEKAILIDKEGLKLTYGKNYTHFGEQMNLYFQIGKTDYMDNDRNVVYRYDAPINFIAQFCNADVDSISMSIKEVSQILGRDLEDRRELDSYETKIFIHSFVNNNNILDGLELIVTNEPGDEFPIIRPTRVN